MQQAVLLSTIQTRQADGRWAGFARVTGMDCAACAVELEQVAGRIAGLDEFSVNPASGWANWVAGRAPAIDELADRALRMGYSLSSSGTDPNNPGSDRQLHQTRSHLLRFLVALLAMMQIMMYSAPEYVYSTSDIGHAETLLLRWAQWVIALPLMLYCALPYHQRAWRAVLEGRLVMDQLVSISVVLAFGLSSLRLTDVSLPVWFDSVAMLLTLLLGVQWWMNLHTAQALKHLSALQPDMPLTVDVKSDGTWQTRPVVQLKRDDVIRLRRGQVSPVDGCMLGFAGEVVQVDEAMRTGEEVPLTKQPGDTVYAGSRNLADALEMSVLALDSDSSLGQLGQLLRKALSNKPAHRALLDGLLPLFVAMVAVCAVASGVYWGLVKGQPTQAWSAVVAVLMVTCPCALALALPLVRLFAIRALADRGVLVRSPEALDHLHAVDTIALDKTGTLTTREAVLSQSIRLIEHNDWPETLLNTVAFRLAQYSTHPLSKALVQVLLPQAHRLSLNLSMQLNNVQVKIGKGISADVQWNGQTAVIRLGSAPFVGLTVNQAQQYSADGPGSAVYVAVLSGDPNPDLATFKVLAAQQFELMLKPVPGLDRELNALSTSHRLMLLSGDQPDTVNAWQPNLKFDVRLGGLTPQEKTRWIAQQQHMGHRILMLGDGLNDAAAFAQSDISVAACSASTLSAEQSDFLLMRPGLQALVDLLAIAKQAHRLSLQNLLWAMAYNALALPLAMSNVLSPWMAALGMGLSSAVVVANALRLRAPKAEGFA
ncbi:cation-translocating P-type ATPase [Limnobacter humi]|uniref:Cation-translocating P-type ATPase n=1 Tax=Limnobacter humi TaxID=1778671 RepID=A0ABT1WDH2_9BURK|nr:cation-translocating P-type ATPase [Limnobacter humi]MCQ8895576.1 cation-translocating P-type ATPase [Limnobacter humi]